MSAFDQNIAHTAQHGVASRVSVMLENLRVARARRSIYRQTVRELGALSDRDLADLGLSRGSIRQVARDAADGLAL
ncbi:DUF1127 domain-containing protein [Paracoccus suum]|uniref:DUF1127 domain-containing protein n=1 Tax=Paracoccus suum TaxID=2259340 RepID=A0A344PJG9_9RHOB|nr:DUF1127 domain-containing protein [Paracoccus suum]AXC49524.1 DUF1127 domain-containing protein [Paracoccus suum]